ncbi:MAG: hypothetical protein ACRCW9_06475 [Cetobacterium sp.]
MKKYYVTFKRDWADEFYYTAVFLSNEEKKLNLEDLAKQYKDKTFNYYFGTNEGWEDVTLSELLEDFDYQEISDSTYEELSKFMDLYEPFDLDDLFCNEDEDEYYDED